MTLQHPARRQLPVILVAAVLALAGCKVSKEALTRVADQQLAVLDGLATNITAVSATLRAMDERLTVVTPKARQANLSNVEARITDARASVDEVMAAAKKMEQELEAQQAASRKLKSAKMGKDDLAAEQAAYTQLEKRAQDYLAQMEPRVDSADEKVRALERAVTNILAGNDEKGADTDGE